MKKRLPGRVCVVTGGTQGIGWAIVNALAQEGAQVYACGLSAQSVARADRERNRLPWADAIRLAQCDVSARTVYEGWLDSVVAQAGRVSVLVHNAAFTRWTDVMEMPVEEALTSMHVAYNGMVFGIKRLVPHMLATGGGSIVNIGSITGSIYVGGASAAYSAAKAAVEAYTRTLQVEMEKAPIHVTLMRLGTVAGTDFFGKHVDYRRMPRLLDFLPYLTVTQVADGVIEAIVEKKEVVTMPSYLRPLQIVYTVAPRFSRWLAHHGGSGKRDYASLG
jgi:NAD(P)-dependent dehydrogenase (short-subunit alcohol dehydrogenase family)